jgi:hypothetical protein
VIKKFGKDGKKTKKVIKGDDTAMAPPQFLPVVSKWAVYNGRDRTGAAAKRFGAPYEYIEGPENT